MWATRSEACTEAGWQLSSVVSSSSQRSNISFLAVWRNAHVHRVCQSVCHDVKMAYWHLIQSDFHHEEHQVLKNLTKRYSPFVNLRALRGKKLFGEVKPIQDFI
jgi:hypothetical protein